MTTNPSTPSNYPFPITRESVCCALCGSNETRLRYQIPLQTRLLSSLWYRGEQIQLDEIATVVRCQRCGLQYVNPRWVVDGAVTSYSDGMEQAYFARTYTRRYQTYQHFVAKLPDWLGRPVHSLLDIGCGDGVLLEAAHTAEIAATGTEFSARLRQLLHEKHNGQIAVVDTPAALPSHAFDVITLINVIEHVAAPQELLADLAAKLAPGGVLFIHTPNADGLPAHLQGARWSQIEPLGHLYYFSAQTLGAMLQKTGFEPMGRFHLAVSGRFRGALQEMLGWMGIYLDNGLGMVARRKAQQQERLGS
ncbi:MAG: class I SAM-dependent methyltransferase [Caldilineaceae bacterium]